MQIHSKNISLDFTPFLLLLLNIILYFHLQLLQQHHYKGEQLDPNASALDHIKRFDGQDETTAVGKLDPGSRQEETMQRAYLSNFGITG